MRLAAIAVVLLLGGCASTGTPSRASRLPDLSVASSAGATATSAPATSTATSSQSTAAGDPNAVSQCVMAEAKKQAELGANPAHVPALNVVAGFQTTEGAAHRYADNLGVKPGDPSPPAAVENDAVHTSTAPMVACILDGDIVAPNLPGNPPYTRELAVIGSDGSLQQLVAGHITDIPLTGPPPLATS
jgi:hypothetical protein